MRVATYAIASRCALGSLHRVNELMCKQQHFPARQAVLISNAGHQLPQSQIGSRFYEMGLVLVELIHMYHSSSKKCLFVSRNSGPLNGLCIICYEISQLTVSEGRCPMYNNVCMCSLIWTVNPCPRP